MQKERRERMENLLRYRAWDKIRKKMGVVISNNWMTGVANIIIDNKETLRQEQDYILMQSTGLKDKNDVEIFEGDVVKQEMLIPTSGIEKITGVVEMLEGAWTIVNDKEEIACHLWREGAEMKILGNIY